MVNKYPYRILFLSSFDPTDQRKLSGVSYSMYHWIKNDFEAVEVLGPVRTRGFLKSLVGKILRMLPVRYNLDHSYFMAWLYAKAFKKLITTSNWDAIFAPRASTETALLHTNIPIIYYTDTTFKGLYNYYEWFSGFTKLSVWEGNRIEKLALRNASACVFSSNWAADSARDDYQINPSKIFLIPWGPNLNAIPMREEVLAPKDGHVCKLLFLGVEWSRKGGEITFNAFKILKDKGYKVSLTVCGCTPPPAFKDEDMHVIPYINKNIAQEYHKFHLMMLSHHLLVLPTRAECYGLVFAEASAYGIPSITTDTGGIGAVVQNGINGYRLPLSAGADVFAQTIENVYFVEHNYRKLNLSTRNFFENELHWPNFTHKLNQVIKKIKGDE